MTLQNLMMHSCSGKDNNSTLLSQHNVAKCQEHYCHALCKLSQKQHIVIPTVTITFNDPGLACCECSDLKEHKNENKQYTQQPPIAKKVAAMDFANTEQKNTKKARSTGNEPISMDRPEPVVLKFQERYADKGRASLPPSF